MSWQENKYILELVFEKNSSAVNKYYKILLQCSILFITSCYKISLKYNITNFDYVQIDYGN